MGNTNSKVRTLIYKSSEKQWDTTNGPASSPTKKKTTRIQVWRTYQPEQVSKMMDAGQRVVNGLLIDMFALNIPTKECCLLWTRRTG
ncbi:MAG: hypothetical protein DRO11_00915 [Methanobacteriota archaeon]|nr:MAG: hypothetical protein DRO11_00915 [Euryarchaeota archaeon]